MKRTFIIISCAELQPDLKYSSDKESTLVQNLILRYKIQHKEDKVGRNRVFYDKDKATNGDNGTGIRRTPPLDDMMIMMATVTGMVEEVVVVVLMLPLKHIVYCLFISAFLTHPPIIITSPSPSSSSYNLLPPLEARQLRRHIEIDLTSQFQVHVVN